MFIGKSHCFKGRRYWKEKYEQEYSARLRSENDLMTANGRLKREINDMKLAAEKSEKTTCTRIECPADCSNKPNYRKCASCIRNPHAVDKYECK